MSESKNSSIECLLGKVFHRLTVVGDLPHDIQPSGQKARKVECRCECGNLRGYKLAHLKNGHTRSCGCLKAEMDGVANTTHGKSRSRAHTTWMRMNRRGRGSCDRRLYADRGIKVCERWLKFENFYADMGDPPDGASIDRIDNDGDYSPENCRWATPTQQARNKRNNRWVEFNGEKHLMLDLSERFGIPIHRLWRRLKNGWTIDDALFSKKSPQLNLVTYKGETLPMTQMAKKYGHTVSNFSQRIGKLGWSVAKAIETPINRMKPRKTDTP